MSTPEALDAFYQSEDPWGYRTNRFDLTRREHIRNAVKFCSPATVLEIGAGEGFISESLVDFTTVDAIELSAVAAGRLPESVRRVSGPRGTYDLVLACGVLYHHYDWQTMLGWVSTATPTWIVASHFDKVNKAHDDFYDTHTLEFYAEFPYREGKQQMKIWEAR